MEVKSKRCCVDNCKSTSHRIEDRGVTFHKFPKHEKLRLLWHEATRCGVTSFSKRLYVCSRHFFKADFQPFKDSKYILRPDAVPSIFSWNILQIAKIMDTNIDERKGPDETDENIISEEVSGNGVNDPITENEASRETLEEQNEDMENKKEDIDSKKEHIVNKNEDILNKQDDIYNKTEDIEIKKDDIDNKKEDIENKKDDIENKREDLIPHNENVCAVQERGSSNTVNKDNNNEIPLPDDTKRENMEIENQNIVTAASTVTDSDRSSITVVRSVIYSNDNISLDASISDLANSSGEVIAGCSDSSNIDYSGSINIGYSPKKGDNETEDTIFPIGTQVEARDFNDKWHRARVMEVDNDEMEVLVHYHSSFRNDEWISSSRIRLAAIPLDWIQPSECGSNDAVKESVEYAVGERCYARWSDNRRFPATVKTVLDNGKYEIIFDDGICRVSQGNCLSKMKKKKINSSSGSKRDLNAENAESADTFTTASTVPFHRHLFDPQLDYLGPKSERREKKKKLDVKTLFNIGRRNSPNISKRKLANSPVDVPVKRKYVRRSKLAEAQLVSQKEELLEDVKEITDLIESHNEPSCSYTPAESLVPEKKEEQKELDPNVSEVDIKTEHNEDNMESEKRKKKKDKSELIKIEHRYKNVKNIAVTEPIVAHTEDPVVENVDIEPKHEVPIQEVTEEIQPEVPNDSKPDIEALGIDKEMIAPTYANSILVDEDVAYGMEVDDGLKLISPVVDSSEKEPESVNNISPMKIALASPQPRPYEATLSEGEWCCKWVDGEPQGVVCEADTEPQIKGDKPVLPRKSVLVEDKRLPAGWQKMLVRRCYGSSAGKWDVVLVDPKNRRLRDKGEMRHYLTLNQNEDLKQYDSILMDFSVHRKLARQMGWDTTTATAAKHSAPVVMSPRVSLSKIKIPLSLKKKEKMKSLEDQIIKKKKKKKKKKLAALLVGLSHTLQTQSDPVFTQMASTSALTQPSYIPEEDFTPMFDGLPLIDGHVYVGSMKVQILENLFRCPADGCFKNFRKVNLLRMHIKHYHRELRKYLGATPKVSDLAYARTAIPENTAVPKLRCEGESVKTPKVKLPQKTSIDKYDKKDSLSPDVTSEIRPMTPSTPFKTDVDKSLLDSPKLRNALEHQTPIKKPKVLYPVKKEVKSELGSPEQKAKTSPFFSGYDPTDDVCQMKEKIEVPLEPDIETLDFETAISTHTVTKPTYWKRKTKNKKKQKSEVSEKKEKKRSFQKWKLEWDDVKPKDIPDYESTPEYEENMTAMEGTQEEPQVIPPAIQETVVQENIVEPGFMISETGEMIKIEHMKREEIINCHCGFGEEDGLMIQCDLCLCWQHAICHNYDSNTVPDKYTCSICLHPRRGRASRRFLHAQAWLYEGELPGGAPDPALRRAHELTANLLRLAHALHTLRLKLHVASKKDHPKLYLWAKDWEATEEPSTKVVTESIHNVDLNEMFGEIGKENLPLKEETAQEKSGQEELSESQREDSQLGSQALLANLLASPNGTALELPISTSELENLAKSVQEAEAMRGGPEPEAAIESGACRENLLRHIQRLQALIDARLDSIEAQVAELESQDPSFEDDETADFFPRTKQTIQMLYRDLNTLEEVAIIT